MILTDEQALNLWLDEHPGDLVARAVLADWLEENGRDDEAEGQRWLIAEKKWPTFEYVSDKASWQDGCPWDWWGGLDADSCIDVGPTHSQMPDDFFTNSRRYRNRTAAERDAIAYARANGLLGKPLSRTAERR